MAQVPLSNKIYIDGLLWAGAAEAKTVTLDSKPITYSFWSDATLDDVYYDGAGYDTKDTPWKNYEIEAMQATLKTWSNVANIKFAQVANNNTEADFKLILVEELFDLAKFGPPGHPETGMGLFNYEEGNWNEVGLKPGGYAFSTLIHELGHGLGLAHPHDRADGGSPLFPGVDSSEFGDFKLNQGVWTVMSYNDPVYYQDINRTDNWWQATPMAFDVAAIQYLYGANMSYRTGKDIYKLPTQNQSGTSYSCIWDAGGIDTISASDALKSATINLNAAPILRGANAGGYISSVKKIYGGITIANNVVIENAVGGSGNDRIVGNNARNSLKGNAGKDYLLGYAKNDLLSGGSDNDRLTGSLGNDSLSGGSDNDHLYGGLGNDSLSGDQGKDWLSGGKGADQFIFNSLEKTIDTIANFFGSQDDQIVVSAKQFGGELKEGNLLSNQFTRGSVAVNEQTRFIYNSSSGQLFFDVDGTGEREQMQFAKIPKGASLSSSGITIVA